MKPSKIRRLAARVLKIGENRVWFDAEKLDSVKESMTKEDVRQLISQGVIRKRGVQGQSKGRTRKLASKKKKGRKRGFGKRRGTRKTRGQKKRSWMKKARSQRQYLRQLRKQKKIDRKKYSEIYKKISGGFFKGKKNIDQAIKG